MTRTTWFGTDMTAGEIASLILPVVMVAAIILFLCRRYRVSTTASQSSAEPGPPPASYLPESVMQTASSLSAPKIQNS